MAISLRGIERPCCSSESLFCILLWIFVYIVVFFAGHILLYCSTLSLTVWKCAWTHGASGMRPDSSVALAHPMLRCGTWSKMACCTYTFTLWGPSLRGVRSPLALIMTTAAGKHTRQGWAWHFYLLFHHRVKPLSLINHSIPCWSSPEKRPYRL